MSINVPVQASFTAPAEPSAKAFSARLGRGIWNALHAIGAARARRELIRLAESTATTNPELAAHLRRVVQEDWLGQS